MSALPMLRKTTESVSSTLLKTQFINKCNLSVIVSNWQTLTVLVDASILKTKVQATHNQSSFPCFHPLSVKTVDVSLATTFNGKFIAKALTIRKFQNYT